MSCDKKIEADKDEKNKLLNLLKLNIEKNLVCELKDNATNMVFGKGDVDAKILFIGEAPGEQEDLQGIPFVGRAGKELDKLLNSINLSIDDVYIANILKYRPPKNRDPNREEIEKHTPYLIEQIKIIKPKIIITLGNYSTKFVLAGFSPKGMNKIDGISKLRGGFRKIELEEQIFYVFPIYHPAAMLYNPHLRNIMEEDFAKLGKVLSKSKEKEQDK